MPPGSTRQRLIALAALVAVAVVGALVALLASGGSDEAEPGGGLAFAGGAYFNPPYAIEADGLE